MRHRAIPLAALVIVAGCGAAEQAAAPPASAPPARAGSAGVTVELPPGWHSAAANDGNVTDPLARVVVASSSIESGSSPCQTSAYTFADDAVALVLVEWQGEADTGSPPPRPARFTAKELSIEPGLHECYRGRSGTAFFADAGRHFGAYVFLGDRAPARLADEVRAVLDTLEVMPGRSRT